MGRKMQGIYCPYWNYDAGYLDLGYSGERGSGLFTLPKRLMR